MIQCPNCGQTNEAVIESLIDVSSNPALKSMLLSGRLNAVRCANCGVTSTIAAPLLYHDAEHELLISFVPIELGMPKPQQDKVIGDLLKQLTASIPKEKFKGYMFQPRNALTMQGLAEQILRADGITPEMMESQRNTVGLLEKLMQAGPDKLDDLIRQHDSEINVQFFQAALALMQQAAEQGQENVVNALAAIQERAALLSTYGQEMTALAEQQEETVRLVAEELEALGEGLDHDSLMNIAIKYAAADEYLQALVGLIRPALDYEFFQNLTLRIGQAPGAERGQLEALRDRLLQLTRMIDQQAQAAMQNAAHLLETILRSPNIDAALVENFAALDDTFLAVLAANLQEAQRRGDLQASGRFREVYEKTVALLQANMRPELQFLNELLASERDEDALALLPQGIASFGPALLDIMDSVGRMLGERGQNELVEKLSFLREAAARQVNTSPS
jgi:hypothetical protein